MFEQMVKALYVTVCVSGVISLRHWASATESTESGSALEGAAPPACQQRPVWFGGLPTVDEGVLHH